MRDVSLGFPFRAAKRRAISLKPRPASWGKTNHIQWLRFRPPDSSFVTLE
jgi:hypothetical protein